MRTVSSYGVEIRKQNIPVRQTMEIYRQAVGYLTEIYAQVWEELRKIPETKKRFNTAEHMVHMTKKNTARFDFDLRFPKMPSYLRRLSLIHIFPFDVVKMDRSLLTGITCDEQAAVFYHSIVTVMQNMGYIIVAEGAETEEEVKLLREWGVDMVQGYYFSRPLPETELLRLFML